MIEKWIKIVARNCYPLHWSAQFQQKFEGIRLGELYWRLTADLLIKCDTPLSHLFAYSDNALDTNFLEYFDEPNEALEAALEEAIGIIDHDLSAEPGDTRDAALALYRRHKLDMGLMVMGYWWSNLAGTALEQRIAPTDWERIKEYALHPYRPTLVAREHAAIAEARGSGAEPRELASDLAAEFGFFHSEYKARAWTTDDYLHELAEPGSESHIETVPALPDDERLRWLIEMSRRCFYIFDEGKSALVRTSWALRETLKELGCDETLVMNCNEDEFVGWAATGTMPPEWRLRERDRFHAIRIWEGECAYFSGQIAVEGLVDDEDIAEFVPVEKVQELKGQVAFKGIVEGRVRVLFSQEDAEQLQSGEILVASMTTPELLMAMKRSAAFVTDEGGITCHAAIIARELKKPCVIGTKTATKVLRNGDLVRVDAERGIVTVL